MPTNDVTSSSATAPVDRLKLGVDGLRSDAGVRSAAGGAGVLCSNYSCFDASGE